MLELTNVIFNHSFFVMFSSKQEGGGGVGQQKVEHENQIYPCPPKWHNIFSNVSRIN